MKFRRKPTPLLLLLPSLASLVGLAAGDANVDIDVSTPQQAQAREVLPAAPGSTEATASGETTKSKLDVGTKDAPVDGKDGKPHAGPWVESGAEKENPVAGQGEEIEEEDFTLGSKPAPRPLKEAPLPEANDGVMDDPNRDAPKKGTTGTEGGVSEKDKTRKAQESDGAEKTENKPDPPKEARPLPHSEQEKMKPKTGEKDELKDQMIEKSAQDEDEDEIKDPSGLEKPSDLPETPHDIPHPVPPTSQPDDDIEAPSSEPLSGHGASDPFLENSNLIQPLHSFVLSLTMILFSEIGDKTFLVAALMAMKHPRLIVFTAAFSALIAMTILSAVLGHAVPTLIPKRFTSFLAAGLFLVFGLRMLREGYSISPDEGVSEEMKEVEMELEEKEHLARKQGRRRSSVSPYVLEAGRGTRKSRSNSRLPSPPRSPSSSPSPSRSPSPSAASTLSKMFVGFNNLFSLLLSPAWVQTFIMTFLGEWGDRSQIATIAMAAGQDYWWVTGGAVTGHALCTAVAVLGGRAIAGRVSLRVVTLGGAFAFLVFGLIYLIEALWYS